VHGTQRTPLRKLRRQTSKCAPNAKR
jgi:hypothetical protein